MELSVALDTLTRPSHRIPETEINCIREHRDEAIPVLLEYVKTAVELGEDLPEDYSSHDIAMYLLAEFRVKEAFPYLIRYLECDSDIVDCIIGDLICEDFGAILASVAVVDDIPRIKEVVENRDLDVFHRLAAVAALQVLYAEDVYHRDEYFSYLRYLLDNVRDDIELTSFLVISCEETGSSEFLPVIEELFEADLIDESITVLKTAKEAFARTNIEDAKQVLRTQRNSSFVRDTVTNIGWWSCFREKPDFGRKVGRNEPCPCGSGKKYKKCCGY